MNIHQARDAAVLFARQNVTKIASELLLMQNTGVVAEGKFSQLVAIYSLCDKESALSLADSTAMNAIMRKVASLDDFEFSYPLAGDKLPENEDAKNLLLTKGGVTMCGAWDSKFCLGWAPIPGRNISKEDLSLKN